MQRLNANKPIKLVSDKGEAYVGIDEATFLKGYRVGFNKNQLKSDQSGETGGNFELGTGFNSSVELPHINKPDGTNVPVLLYNAEETNELYVGYWNSNNIHTIFCVDGLTQNISLVDIGSHLNFSLDPKHRIAPHRCVLRVFYGANAGGEKVIREKALIFTDGFNWQTWINVRAGIGTNGFDATAYPYFKLYYPHYDRREFTDLAVRPPMLKPEVIPVPPTESDKGKPNSTLDRSTQFAFMYIYTDGRPTTLSPYSTPYINVRPGFSLTDSLAVRCLDLKLYAGSGNVEQIVLLVRFCGGDWYKYDTIDKFSDCGPNDKTVIGEDYWKRVNPWEGLNYDETLNTITYRYCGDRELGSFSQDDANRIQSDLPILSVGQTPAADALLYGDNLYGYDNISCDILDQFRVSVTEDNSNAACEVNLVNIKVYAFITRQEQWTQPIWMRGEDGERFFGGASERRLNPIANKQPYDIWQQEAEAFNLRLGTKDGMICYLAGTDYKSIGKQYSVVNGTKTLIGPVDVNDPGYKQYLINLMTANGYFIQEFEFNVPAGNYVARLANHTAGTDSIYYKTSTYVQGICNRDFLAKFKLPNGQVTAGIPKAKEIEIFACGGDVDFWDPQNGDGIFHIYCPASFDYETWADGSRFKILGRFIEGYLHEDTENDIPVERVAYEAFRGDPNYNKGGWYTDHNGFFFTTSSDGSSERSEVLFRSIYNCADSADVRFTTNIGGDNRGYFPNQNKYFKQSMGNSYGPCNRVKIPGRIVDQKTGEGLAGIGITLAENATYFTDAEGNFTIITHPYNGVNTNRKIFYNSTRPITIEGCECVGYDTYDESLVPCVNCNERIYPLTFSKAFIGALLGVIKSHKDGGRYGVNASLGDPAGRMTFSNTVGYVDMPTIPDMGKIVPLRIRWDLLAPVVFPDWAKWISFQVTSNQVSKKFLQWVGDGIKFLDRTGNEVLDGNGAILSKITIQSLLDYNTENNLSTNTAYQFVPGDIVRIYDDGDGNYFPSTAPGGFMDFIIRGTNFNTVAVSDEGESEDGKSIVIDYDSRLLALKDKCGFWIEIMSPKDLSEDVRSCEVMTYAIINNKIVLDGVPITGQVLDSFDSYFVNRQIVIEECSGNAIAHPFISSSITDFFGAGCTSCGRLFVKDDAAKQTWYTDDTIKSDDLVNEGRVNGLGTFRESNRKQFKGKEWGGIVAMHAERGIVAFICANDWFLTDYNQNYVKTTAEGILTVNLDRNLSDPHQKVGQNYGCRFEETATIDFFDGLCIWADINNSAVVAMNYQEAVDIARIDNKSYFVDKFRYTKDFNNKLAPADYLNNLVEISGGTDPSSRIYHLTFRPRRMLSRNPSAFINNEREKFLDMQETILFSLDQKAWVGFAPYTPEMYCRFKDSSTGLELVTSASGNIHYHNSKGVKSVNTFYGIKTEQVIELVGTGEEAKDKLLQGIVQDSRGIAYTIDSIKTNLPNVYSYVPRPYFKKEEGMFNAAALRNCVVYPNINKPKESHLIDGGVISGVWFKIRLVRDINFIDGYNELNYVFLRYITREKSKK
jgi:hypothetical protein